MQNARGYVSFAGPHFWNPLGHEPFTGRGRSLVPPSDTLGDPVKRPHTRTCSIQRQIPTGCSGSAVSHPAAVWFESHTPTLDDSDSPFCSAPRGHAHGPSRTPGHVQSDSGVYPDGHDDSDPTSTTSVSGFASHVSKM
jgi:hypothetical protein